MKRVAMATLALGALAAAGIRGPVSGYVLDERSHAIRPVNGIPGAATLGNPVNLGFQARLAAIGRDVALVAGFDDHDQLFLARELEAETPAVSAVEGAIGGIGRIVWNETGDAALLYSPSAGQFQVITGVAAVPRLSVPIDAGPVAAALNAMALNAGADRIAAAGGQDGALYLFSSAGDGSWNYKLLAAASGVPAILFRNSGRDVIYASKANDEIIAIRDIDGTGDISVLAGSADGVSVPVGLAAANGDRELWVANQGSSSLLAFDMAAGGAPQNIPLASAPSRCDRLDWKSLLVLNDVGGAPLLLLDGAQGRSVFFVPVD